MFRTENAGPFECGEILTFPGSAPATGERRDMEKNDFREQYTQAFYRSLEEGKIEITALPAAQLQALCRACSEATFAALQSLEEVDNKVVAPNPVGGDEEVLVWSAKSELTLGLRYELTSQRLRIFRGMFGRSLHEVDLITVREAKMTQQFGERMVNIGDIILVTSSPENPEVRIENIRNPLEVREVIRKAYMAEQKRRGLRYQDQV